VSCFQSRCRRIVRRIANVRHRKDEWAVIGSRRWLLPFGLRRHHGADDKSDLALPGVGHHHRQLGHGASDASAMPGDLDLQRTLAARELGHLRGHGAALSATAGAKVRTRRFGRRRQCLSGSAASRCCSASARDSRRRSVHCRQDAPHDPICPCGTRRHPALRRPTRWCAERSCLHVKSCVAGRCKAGYEGGRSV
jgi:hypothetical protein